jgi:hypothetical protein
MQKKLIFNALTLINEPLNILIAIKGKKPFLRMQESRLEDENTGFLPTQECILSLMKNYNSVLCTYFSL